MRHISGILLIAFLLSSCYSQTKQEVAVVESTSPVIGITVFSSEYGGFGYAIRVDGKLLVQQPNIPAVAGNQGFPTEESARRVAGLVVQKIKENQMPPTLTIEELHAVMAN